MSALRQYGSICFNIHYLSQSEHRNWISAFYSKVTGFKSKKCCQNQSLGVLGVLHCSPCFLLAGTSGHFQRPAANTAKHDKFIFIVTDTYIHTVFIYIYVYNLLVKIKYIYMKRANSSKLSKLGLFDWASMLVLEVGSTLESVSILM